MGNTPSTHFSKHYASGKPIGSGTFATVKRCMRRSDKSEFAVKIVNKNQLTYEEICRLTVEINILQTIKQHKHPHIITIEDVFESDHKVKMVLELCQNNHLLDIINEAPNRRLHEKTAAKIIHTLTKTLKFLHENGVVHRDIKPENILFSKKEGILKIADFGSAYKHKKNKNSQIKSQLKTHIKSDSSKMKTHIGTPLYVAPEVLLGRKYSHMVDLWSLGVVLYICLCGYHPFSCRKSLDKMYQNIMKGKFQFSSPLWDNIDADAIDLVRKLLTVDVNKRITCDQLMKHKWILKHVDVTHMV